MAVGVGREERLYSAVLFTIGRVACLVYASGAIPIESSRPRVIWPNTRRQYDLRNCVADTAAGFCRRRYHGRSLRKHHADDRPGHGSGGRHRWMEGLCEGRTARMGDSGSHLQRLHPLADCRPAGMVAAAVFHSGGQHRNRYYCGHGRREGIWSERSVRHRSVVLSKRHRLSDSRLRERSLHWSADQSPGASGRRIAVMAIRFFLTFTLVTAMVEGDSYLALPPKQRKLGWGTGPRRLTVARDCSQNPQPEPRPQRVPNSATPTVPPALLQ